MEKPNYIGYDFKDFQQELEDLDQTHPNVIRRESGVTYRDEFALLELQSISERHYEQVLEGWSRSYYLPEKHLEAILAYSMPNIPSNYVNQKMYAQCIDVVIEGLRSLPSVRAFDVLTELDQVSFKSSTAAGYGYIGAKGAPGDLNHRRAIARAKAVMWSAINPKGEGIDHVLSTAVPDVGYTRTQLTEITVKTKVRSVWGRAFHYILLEGLFADPLLKSFIETETFYHIGQDPTHSVPNILSILSEQCKWKYAIDWKQFDATVSRFEIHAAFDILQSKLIFPNDETRQTFEICRQLFIHKKIAAPDGKVYWAHHGIPSGSYFTSIVGSIINRLRIEYLWRTITGHGPKICYTQGDDSLCGDDILIPPEKFAEVANLIGWYFNPDKTEYSVAAEAVSFLGRTYHGGMNERDLIKCLRLLIFPEYPVQSGRISAYRARSIAEDAGGISDLLNRIALRLKRQHGVASEEEVPSYFKLYVLNM
nr:RNA-dependent RNA polymerase [Polygonatum partitivirus 2]